MQSDRTGEVDTHSVRPSQEQDNDHRIVPARTERTETTDVGEPQSIRAFRYFNDVTFRHRPKSRSLRTSTFVFVHVAKDHVVEYENSEGLPRAFNRRGIKAVEKSKGTSMPQLARMSFQSVNLPENVMSFNIFVGTGIIAQAMFRSMGHDLETKKTTLSAKQSLPLGIVGIQSLSEQSLQNSLDRLPNVNTEIIAGWKVVRTRLTGRLTTLMFHPVEEADQTLDRHWQMFVDPASPLIEQWFDEDDDYNAYICQGKLERSSDVEKLATPLPSRLTPLMKAIATALFTFGAAAKYITSKQRPKPEKEELLRSLFISMTKNVLGDREAEQKAIVESRESATSRLSRFLAQRAQDKKSAQIIDTESQQFTPADGQESGVISSPEPNTSIQKVLDRDHVGSVTDYSLTETAPQAIFDHSLPATSETPTGERTSTTSALRTSPTQDTLTFPTSSTLDTSFATSTSNLGRTMPRGVAAEKRAGKSGKKKSKTSRNNKNKNKNKNKDQVPSEEGSRNDAVDNTEQISSPTRSTSAGSDGTLVDPATEDTNERLQAASGEQAEENEARGTNPDIDSGAEDDTNSCAERDTSTTGNLDTAPNPKKDTISGTKLPEPTENQEQVSSEYDSTADVLSKLDIDQPEEAPAHTTHPTTPKINYTTKQKVGMQIDSSNVPKQSRATEQGSRVQNRGQLPTIAEEDETTSTKEQATTIEETQASTSEEDDPERTPRPAHATLPVHAATPVQTDQPEPAGEVFRFDNYHPETRCRNPECRKATHPLDGSTRICPACGLRSKVRYCSRPCLYKDVRRHFMNECRTLTINGPIDENSLCADNNARRPYVRHATEQMVNTVERHRQAVWYATEAIGEYFIFDDVEVCDSANPSKEEVQEVRGMGECVFVVFVPEDVSRVFRRALVSSLMWGATPINTVNCAALAGMVMEVLKAQGECDQQMYTNLCMQMGFELGYQIPPEAQVWH